MEERTKRLDGKLAITSAPGTGTCVRVEIPINSIQASEASETGDAAGSA
jgi:nitrate/nitrite-specific signal transduction histidine kinase